MRNSMAYNVIKPAAKPHIKNNNQNGIYLNY